MNESAGDVQDVNTVLFLCSGNYYRSRFAEELFNHMAAARGVLWMADSAGLNMNPNNRGPVSDLVLQRLEKLGISPLHGDRHPRPAQSSDFSGADIIVAMSHKEHYDLMRKAYPNYITQALFWDVQDVGETDPDEALTTIEALVDNLVDELRNGCRGLGGTG